MTINTETLLDKLYNLRGSDSEILKEMDRQKSKAEETKNRTTAAKVKLQSDISDLKKQREELEDQGEKFVNVLQGIHREDFETVLNRLHIDFNPSHILEKIEKNLPQTIENVEKDTQKAEDELVKVEEEMNEAITTIEELGIRRDAALANQQKLNEYFNLALEGRINITRDSITSLLNEFGFNELEQRETAKILMFPEDALFAYDEKVKNKEKSGKSISEVIQEAKEMVEEDSNHEVDEAEDIPKEESFDKETVIEFLKSKGIDYLDFTAEEMDKLIQNFNKTLVESNIDYMQKHSLDMDIFVNYISMMYDPELRNKIELLLSVGKETLDIYLNPSVLVKYDLRALEDAILALKGNGLNPQEVPLMAY